MGWAYTILIGTSEKNKDNLGDLDVDEGILLKISLRDR
jgi:hypothetical protein